MVHMNVLADALCFKAGSNLPWLLYEYSVNEQKSLASHTPPANKLNSVA